MHHAKTDSEVTSSLAPSSPPRPAYYVQSPSHDGENKTASFHSSPAASPPRSLGHHSRESSSSRFSGKVSGRRSTTTSAGGGGHGRSNPWKGGGEAVIEEEGLLEEEAEMEERRGIPRKCYVLGFVGAFFVLFFFFALILWGASHNQRPVVSMNSITFHNFVIQAGTDASLVPTELSTLNATVKFTFRNTGSFFGVHVSAQPLTLYYTQLLMASGHMNYFYQSRKSQRNLAVELIGDKVPLYGGGVGLSSTPGTGTNTLVPFDLTVRIRSRAYVLGKLVKPKFYTNIHCSIKMDQTKLGKSVSLNKSCQYN